MFVVRWFYAQTNRSTRSVVLRDCLSRLSVSTTYWTHLNSTRFLAECWQTLHDRHKAYNHIWIVFSLRFIYVQNTNLCVRQINTQANTSYLYYQNQMHLYECALSNTIPIRCNIIIQQLCNKYDIVLTLQNAYREKRGKAHCEIYLSWASLCTFAMAILLAHDSIVSTCL